MGGHRRVARGAEPAEVRALGERADPRGPIVDAIDPGTRRAVGGAHLDRDDPLPHGGHEDRRVQRLRVLGLEPEAGEPRGGKDHGVPGSALELPHARLHVAPDRLDDEVGPERQRQGPPARARRPDDRAHRQVLEGRPRPAHEDVTRILAFGERRQREPRRQFGGEILEAVDRAVDQPFAQRLLDLPHEQALAPDGGQTGVDPPVALGPDRDDLDVDPERPQTCGHRSGLYQRERASPRPELHWTECLGAGIRRGWRAVGTAWLRAANAHCIIVTRLTITSRARALIFCQGRRARGRAPATSGSSPRARTRAAC